MPFKSLHHVLGSLEDQASWQEQKQFKRLLSQWGEIVGPAVASQTRPVAIQRNVLIVAASSPAWAQNLLFERHRILQKLNAQLRLSLQDIRFSTAYWHRRSLSNQPDGGDPIQLWRSHPSALDSPAPFTASTQPNESTTPETAFESWANRMKTRSRNLPLCDRCQCPTPQGELERWSCCAICAAKQWQTSS